MGATASDLEWYCVRLLEMETPDICIIHVGTNDIGQETDAFKIAEKIIKVVKMCHEKGCNKVYVSSLIYRPDHPNLVVQINNVLMNWQALYNYEVICNDNIDEYFIARDKLHLSRRGKDRLWSNYRRTLNKLHS